MSFGLVSPTPEGDPVSSAAIDLARDIHNGLLNELGLSYGMPDGALDAEMAAQSQKYPFLLFGALAVHISGVEIPSTASEADRARAILESMRRITSTPSLMESITKAPYTSDAAAQLLRGFNELIPDRSDNELALKVRGKAAKYGFIDRSMIPTLHTVQLEYQFGSSVKKHMLRKDEIIPGSSLRMKLSATKANVDIKRYKKRDGYGNYSGYIDTRNLEVADVFAVLAVSSSDQLPDSLSTLSPRMPVRFGQISPGGQLHIDYDFKHPEKEVPGYEEYGPSYRSMHIPATLTQAYFGESRDYPLFPRQ